MCLFHEMLVFCIWVTNRELCYLTWWCIRVLLILHYLFVLTILFSPTLFLNSYTSCGLKHLTLRTFFVTSMKLFQKVPLLCKWHKFFSVSEAYFFYQFFSMITPLGSLFSFTYRFFTIFCISLKFFKILFFLSRVST